MPAQEYLEAVLDTLKKIVPKETFDQIHALALPVSGGRAKANHAKQEEIEKLKLIEMNNKEIDYDKTLGIARAAERLGKVVGIHGLKKDDLEALPEEVMIVPDFVSIVGSSVRSDTPNDIDVLYRADSTDRGDFIVRWENGHLALRNTLSTIKPDLDMHEIYNPQGSREQQWLPVYHLVLRKSKDELRMVKQEAPSLPNWQDYLPLDKESDDVWLDLGCGQDKADGFIGIDQELYPNVDIKTDISKGIPFNDSSVSVVRANHFIEHMPDFENIMTEIARVLMDGGICIMTMPSTNGAGAYAHPDHKVFMNKTEFESKIARMDYFEPKLIVDRPRENNGIPCVDIDAVLIRKERIQKLEPLQTFVPTKPEMAGFTEAFAVDDLAKWAQDRYPFDVEPKWNGFRSVISKKGGKVELWFEGKMGTDQLDKFPDLKTVLEKIPDDFVIDTDIGMERNGRRLPRTELMTFNANEPVFEKDDMVIVTLFDLLYRDKEDITKKAWAERRPMLEDFFSDYLKDEKNFKLSPMRVVKNEKELSPAVHWAFGFPMSEGLVAKDLKSQYEQGGTRNWFKLKKVAELKVIVLQKQTTKAGAFNYWAGLLPSPGMDFTNTRDFKGKKYIDLGKTFSTSINAKPGDIITVTVIEIIPDTEQNTLAWVGPRVIDIDDTRSNPYTVEQAISISERAKILQKDLINIVPSAGKPNSQIAFVGASPGRIEMLRSEPLVGPSGETFNEQYLAPLGLSRSDVFITNAVPILLLDQEGNVREPTPEEINTWHEWLIGELERANPKVIVALGKIARKALDGEADFILPHPMAIRRFGDSGEVGRKIKQIRTKLDEMNKGLPGVEDVHIPSTNWRRLKKADAEGGDETRSAAAVEFWNNNWQNMYPIKGNGDFTYQHHWRGLSEDEVKLSEDNLLETNHSVHGDLRFTAHKGEDLWGFSVFIGQTAENRDPKGDRLITLPPEKNIQGTFKLAEPLPWLTIARTKPYTAAPGEPGSTSQSYSKFFEQDHGQYKMGVWKQHIIELFIDGGKLKGRYLIEFAPVGGQRIWLIDKPADQTPLADSKNIDAEIKDQRKKGRKYIIWEKPGKEPIPIKISGSEEPGFVMADKLLEAMGDNDDPWAAYDNMPKATNKEIYADIIKADNEKHLVYGVVLEPGSVDAQNDTIGPEEIERAAHVYLQDSRIIGNSHKEKARATVVESYIAPTDFTLGGQKVTKGTWIMTVKINDDKLWQDVKDGKFSGFSIGGFSRRIPVDNPAN